MANLDNFIKDKNIEFIDNQKIFFVGTAAEKGTVNVSPKGMDTLRIIDKNTIAWLNLTGSGNETAAHLLKKNRMTIMWCAFEGKPLILRVYGRARILHPRDKEFEEYIHLFPEISGSRQIFLMSVEKVQESCGYSVPFMEFREERKQLESWAKKQGKEKIHQYWKKHNQKSIDGFDTKIF